MKRLARTAMGFLLASVMLCSTALVASASVSVDVSGHLGYVDITETYRITYDANGGDGGRTGPDIVPGGTDTVLSPSEAGVSREGYGFLGWNTERDGAGAHYTSGDTITLDGSITLYAQWQEISPGAGEPAVLSASGSGGGTSEAAASPKTGDTAGVLLWYGFSLAALCTLLLLYWTERRNKNRKPKHVM